MAQQQMAVKQEPSLGDLFSELAAQTGTLVRQEVSLAQLEISSKAATAGKQIGYLVVGGAVGYAAFLTLLAAIVIGLSTFLPWVLSALITAAAVGAVGYWMITSALEELKKRSWAPNETVESIKEDAQWLKNQVS
jgi:uncharacterized membrane protein YqjE